MAKGDLLLLRNKLQEEQLGKGKNEPQEDENIAKGELLPNI